MNVNSEKGQKTKLLIINTSRTLFYKYGFKKTTFRSIAKELNVNLGLFSYYFKNKAEMGLIIYKTIRQSIRDQLEKELGPETIVTMLLHFVLDIKLLTYSSAYKDLYLGISRDDAFINFIKSRNLFYMQQFSKFEEEYTKFSAIAMSVVKPEIVRLIMTEDDIDERKLRSFIVNYLNLYITVLKLDTSIIDKVLLHLEEFDIELTTDFVPVVKKKSH
jgi:AcrR family transcriptional regulator